MRLSDLLAALHALGRPYFQTRDAAALLGIRGAYANMALQRLSEQHLVIHLAQGRWALPGISGLLLPEALATPFPAYCSLFTALHHHGLIEQIPSVVYAVTLGRTRRVETPLATVSFHHVVPGFFFGFEPRAQSAPMATPEKALVDTLYLLPTRSQLFRKLPELEFPRQFSWSRARKAAQAIPGPSRRTMVLANIERLQLTHQPFVI